MNFAQVEIDDTYSGTQKAVPRYNPNSIPLLNNWIFDNYAADSEGGDNFESLLTNFKSKILEDRNIIEVFKSEIEVKKAESIIERMKLMIDNKFYLDELFGFKMKEKNLKTMKDNGLVKVITIETGSSFFKQYVKKEDIIDGMISEYINIVREIDLSKFDELAYPFGVETPDGGHAIGSYFKKIEPNKFMFYVINAGSGSEYQNIADDYIKNYGIQCFEINKEQLDFIYGIILAGDHYLTIESFYNVVLRILFTNQENFFTDETIKDKFLCESPCFKKSINLNLQVMGNCTVVSLVNILEILLRENDEITTNNNFELSKEFLNLYNKIKIVLLFYYLSYFVTLDNNVLSSKNYPYFIKLNETYLLLKDSEYKLQPYDNYNNILIKSLYEFYMNDIENYSELKGFNFQKYEKNCTELRKFEKIKNNEKFNLDFLKEPSNLNEKIIESLDSQLEAKLVELSISNIEEITKFEDIELFLKNMVDYFEIVLNFAQNSEDFVRMRLRQFQTIELIINFYKKINTLIGASSLDNKFNIDNISKYIYRIGYLFSNFNDNYYLTYHKKEIDINYNRGESEDNKPFQRYKLSIYDSFTLYLVMIIGNIYDYVNDNKVEEYEFSNEYLNNKLSNIFSHFILTNKNEYEIIKELIGEIVKNNKYFAFNDNSFGKLEDGPALRTAKGERGGTYLFNLDSYEIVNCSSFKLLNMKFNHEENPYVESFGFKGKLDLSHFSNLFREELISKKFNEIEEYFDYIENNLENPTSVNWILVKLNILFYKADLEEVNFTKKSKSKIQKKKEEILANFHISLVNFLGEEVRGESQLFINDIFNKVNEFFYGRKNNSLYISQNKEKKTENISWNPVHNDDDSSNKRKKNLNIYNPEYDTNVSNIFRQFLIKYSPFFNLDKTKITYNQNLIESNLDFNMEIFNKDYYQNIIIYISYLIKNNLTNLQHYESFFNIVLIILNFFAILDIKLDKDNRELVESFNIINREFTPIIKFILKEYHDFDVEYNKKELIEYINRTIKFNKTSMLPTNLDSLLNIILYRTKNDEELKNEILKSSTFKQVLIQTSDDKEYQHEVNIDETFAFHNNNFIINKFGSIELVDKISKYKTIDTSKKIRIHYPEFLKKLFKLKLEESTLFSSRTNFLSQVNIISTKNIKLLTEEKTKKDILEKEHVDITITFDNFGFKYQYVDDYFYEYYKLNGHNHYDFKYKIDTKDVYNNDRNSMLQLFYKPEYSYLIVQDYELENPEDNTVHICKLKDELIKISLNKDNINITINDNKVLLLTDLMKDRKLFEIYIKLLKLINMNIDDNYNERKGGKVMKEGVSLKINELIPIKIGNKIKFDCKTMKIYFMYNLDNSTLSYLDQDEIITSKNYYFVNRYIYNTDCMVVKHKNFKYSIMVMNKWNKSLNFVKINYNGIFSDSNLESLLYLIKQLINIGSFQEANIIYQNIKQNELLFDEYIKKNSKPVLTITKFLKFESIYENYFLTLLSKYTDLYDDLEKFTKIIKLNMGQIKYYNYFKYDLLNNIKLLITNNCILTNKIYTLDIIDKPVLDSNKTIERAIFIKKYIMDSEYNIIISNNSDLSILKSINSYEHFDKSINKSFNYIHEYKTHSNKKVKINDKSWEYGPDILSEITLNYIKKEDFYKEKIDTDLFTQSKLLKDEYKEDSVNIIKDYDEFYKEEIARERVLIDRPNLKSLLKAVAKHCQFYMIKNNEANKLENSKRFENINYLDIITDFNIKHINRIMLLNKYSTLLEEIISLLSTKKDYYDISKMINYIMSKPIFIDKDINSYLICFEYLFGNHIRQKQLNFANELYDEILLKDRENGPNLHQLLMGEGKSSVIAPILTLNLLGNGEMNKDSIIYHVMPVSLVNQSYDIFNKIFYYLDRNLLGVISEKKDLSKIFSKKIMIISDYLLKYKKVTSDNVKEFDMCKNIFIYDEVDEVSDPLKSQLNIIDGDPSEIENSSIIFEFIHKFIYNLYFNHDYEELREELSNYQFNKIPHLINQNTDIHVEAKKLINKLFLDNINELLGSNYLEAYTEIIINDKLDYDIKHIKLNILNFLFSFYNLLPNILSQLHRRHFGLKFNNLNDISILTNQENKKNYELSQINKNFIAIPFVSNETPSDKSEFSDHLFTIALTVICYYEKSVRRIRNVDIQIYLNYLIKLYNLEKFKPLEKNKGLILFNKLIKGINIKDKPNFSDKITVNDFKNEDIGKLVNNFPLEFYLVKLLLPEVIRVNENYKNISFIDIIKSSFSPHRIGFTGTPFIHKPYEIDPKNELKYICKQIHGDGAIIASIVGFTRKAKLISDINDKTQIIDLAIRENYHCIIDVGSYFINEEIETIAFNILEKLKSIDSEINCVVYINKQHKKMSLMKDGRILSYDSLNIPLKNRFYFFDQSHITGIDMKIYSEAKGLLTLSSFNRYRDVAQGIFRLRNINNGQTVDFCFNNNFKLNLDKNKLNLINFLIYNEFRYKLSQAPLFYKQNILTLYRTYFEDKNIYKLDDISDKFNYLKTNIYYQSYKIDDITEITDAKMDLIKLFKKQINEVIKLIENENLIEMIQEFIVNVDSDNAEATVENEEELGQENQLGIEMPIDQPVEMPIEQPELNEKRQSMYIMKIKEIETKCFFEYDKFKGIDILDLSFSPYKNYPIAGYIPSWAKVPSDDIHKIPKKDSKSPHMLPVMGFLAPSLGFAEQPSLGPPSLPSLSLLPRTNPEPAQKVVSKLPIDREIAILPKNKHLDYTLNVPSDHLNQHFDDYGYADHDPNIISRYLFKHFINNIYIPITNINYKNRINFAKFGDTFHYIKFIVDSFLEIFDDNPDSPNYCKLSHIILLRNVQAIRIIKDTFGSTKLLKLRDKSGFTYYESNKDKIKRYPDNYNSTLNLIYILLDSNKINNLEILSVFDELIGKGEDLISKFRIEESHLSNLFGIFTKEEFYKVMLFTKIINDYNIFLEGKTEIYNEKQISQLIEKIKENMSRCSDAKTIERYTELLDDPIFITNIIPKFLIFFRRFISLNTDNILKYLDNVNNKIENLWEIVKISYSYDKEYNDNSC